MEPVVVISILGGLIILLLFIGAPLKPVRFIGQGVIKLLIGALFLFFLNAFGLACIVYIVEKWSLCFIVILNGHIVVCCNLNRLLGTDCSSC